MTHEHHTVSCGCCTNGCICWNHQDTPRGLSPTVCPFHQTTPHPHETCRPACQTALRFFTGKNHDPLTKCEHTTYEEACARIKALAKEDPIGVERGDYYLDVPEEFVVPA